MLALQEAKAALGKGALAKLSPDEARAARLADLRILLDVPPSASGPQVAAPVPRPAPNLK